MILQVHDLDVAEFGELRLRVRHCVQAEDGVITFVGPELVAVNDDGKECFSLLAETAEVRFAADEILREATLDNLVAVQERARRLRRAA